MRENKTMILAAKNLLPGDGLFSKSSNKYLVVTKLENRVNRTIILFDGDMEIDFDPYCQLEVVRGAKATVGATKR